MLKIVVHIYSYTFFIFTGANWWAAQSEWHSAKHTAV